MTMGPVPFPYRGRDFYIVRRGDALLIAPAMDDGRCPRPSDLEWIHADCFIPPLRGMALLAWRQANEKAA
jgi:hypothetical protein